MHSPFSPPSPVRYRKCSFFFFIFIYLAAFNDYDGVEKRGGDSMFATGAVGRSFNRMGNYYGSRRAGAGSFMNQARFGWVHNNSRIDKQSGD